MFTIGGCLCLRQSGGSFPVCHSLCSPSLPSDTNNIVDGMAGFDGKSSKRGTCHLPPTCYWWSQPLSLCRGYLNEAGNMERIGSECAPHFPLCLAMWRNKPGKLFMSLGGDGGGNSKAKGGTTGLCPALNHSHIVSKCFWPRGNLTEPQIPDKQLVLSPNNVMPLQECWKLFLAAQIPFPYSKGHLRESRPEVNTVFWDSLYTLHKPPINEAFPRKQISHPTHAPKRRLTIWLFFVSATWAVALLAMQRSMLQTLNKPRKLIQGSRITGSAHKLFFKKLIQCQSRQPVGKLLWNRDDFDWNQGWHGKA